MLIVLADIVGKAVAAVIRSIDSAVCYIAGMCVGYCKDVDPHQGELIALLDP